MGGVAGSQTNMDGDASPDTGSTGSTLSVDVLRPGVSKVPAALMAKLHCGAAYMCCFDGSERWGEGGGGSCAFRIRTDGRRNERLHFLDRQVYLPSATATRAEYAGMLAGVVTFAEALQHLAVYPKLLLVEGDNKCIVQHVRDILESQGGTLTLEDDPSLQPIFDEIVRVLRRLDAQGVKVCLRHRPRHLNKAADHLAKLARQQDQCNFVHDLV